MSFPWMLTIDSFKKRKQKSYISQRLLSRRGKEEKKIETN